MKFFKKTRYAEPFTTPQYGDVVIPTKGKYKGRQGYVTRPWGHGLSPSTKQTVLFYDFDDKGKVSLTILGFYKNKHLKVCKFLNSLVRPLRVGDEVFLLKNYQIPLEFRRKSIPGSRRRITSMEERTWVDYTFESRGLQFLSAHIDINKTNLLLSRTPTPIEKNTPPALPIL